MRACVVAWVVAVVAAAAVSCAPPDEDRCGDSGKYYWDAAVNSCFAVITDTGDPVPSVDSTPDTDTDTNITGIGEPCVGAGADASECAGYDATFCADSPVLPPGSGVCTVFCKDTQNFTDCPAEWSCCVFIIMEDENDDPYQFCMPPEQWATLKSRGTCSNWKKP